MLYLSLYDSFGRQGTCHIYYFRISIKVPKHFFSPIRAAIICYLDTLLCCPPLLLGSRQATRLMFYSRSLGVEILQGSKFTKTDISNGGVVYSSNGDADALSDSIVIDVSDGMHHIPAHIRVIIMPVDSPFPTYGKAVTRPFFAAICLYNTWGSCAQRNYFC